MPDHLPMRRSVRVSDPITVYGKPGCPTCSASCRVMKSRGVEFEYRDITLDPDAEARVRELGYSSLPVFEADGTHFQMGDKFQSAVALRVSN